MTAARTAPAGAQFVFAIPIALAGGGAILPFVRPDGTSLILGVLIGLAWIVAVGIALVRVGRRAWWLALGAPFALAMPLLFGWLFVACSIGPCDL